MNGSLFDLDDLFGETVYLCPHLSNQIFWDFEDKECRLHVLPSDVEMYVLDGHVLVERNHVWALVVAGASEERGQELDHGRVQLWDVADIL